LKVGLCGFTISAAEYYRTFPVLEVQQTFYDPPPLRTVSRWRAEAPASFEFTLKAWQVITHTRTSQTYRRMRTPFSEKERDQFGGFRLNETTRRAWDTTLACTRALRATAILLQCPASFKPTDVNVANLQTFVRGVERPSRVRLLWEPRGDWASDLVASLCAELDLVHVVDPFKNEPTGSKVYWRLHGIGNHYASYTDEELAQLKTWASRDPDGYVMFNNIPRVGDAKRFMMNAPTT
jgi:uncharacterized protein YecE (DUF72 family)